MKKNRLQQLFCIVVFLFIGVSSYTQNSLKRFLYKSIMGILLLTKLANCKLLVVITIWATPLPQASLAWYYTKNWSLASGKYTIGLANVIIPI